MTTESHICPNCLAEYEGPVGECERCGSRVLPHAVVDEIVQRTRRDSAMLPAAEDLVRLREAPLAWARALSQRLMMAGIPHRLEDLSGRPQVKSAFGFVDERMFAIFVPPADEVIARSIDAAYARQELPDMTEMEPENEGRCPACGDVLDESEGQCRGCGLVIGP